MSWDHQCGITKDEFDRRVKKHREALQKPRLPDSWERTVKAQNEDRWLLPLAMNDQRTPTKS